MKLLRLLLLVAVCATIVFAQGDNTNLKLVSKWAWNPEDPIAINSVRGLVAGKDIDGDGILEIWSTNYDGGGGIAGFEMVNDSTLELIYADTSGSEYYSGTRWVEICDLDGDGAKEAVYFAGRYASDPKAGLYIVECTGDNTFAEPVFFPINSLGFTFNGMQNLNELRVEHFIVEDVDGDGIEELVFATNGASFVTDYIDTTIVGVDTTVNTYGHSEDFFGVLSVSGDLQSGFGTIAPEFATSARDIDMGTVGPDDPMFGRDNRLGGGSAICVGVADTDGDGLKELVLHSWNNFNTTFVEITGADTYEFGDTTYQQMTAGDHTCLKNFAVLDIDEDGKDEVFMSNYVSGEVYMIADKNGEATNFDSTEYETILSDIMYRAFFGMASGDIDQDGLPDLYISTNTPIYDVLNLEYNNGVWDVYTLLTDSLANSGEGFSIACAVADLDKDGFQELITAHQGVEDTVVIDGQNVFNPRHWSIRVMEYYSASGVREMNIITPGNYELSQAYPNPFNPTTNIEFKLPLQKKISLVIYNTLGQEVRRLVNNEVYQAGSYTVIWNGKDTNGHMVPSGAYIYSLEFGNFRKTKTVTLLK